LPLKAQPLRVWTGDLSKNCNVGLRPLI